MIESPPIGARAVHWTHLAYERIAQQAFDRAGLTFPENRRESTEAAIGRAMVHAGHTDLATFADRVRTDARTFGILLTELTVGETYFFRDPSQWDLLRTLVAPALLKDRPDGRGVRAWSAGCASGEEAYTLAITLREAGCREPSVVGTDLCEYRLQRATRGVYTKWSMRGLEDSQRRRYFRESGQYFHLLPEFRDVRFLALNLADATYGSAGQELFGLDLVLCRNVLIYIDPDVVNAIFERLVASLREGGWLMIAASDPQPAPELPLDVIVTEHGLLFRKNSAAMRSAAPLNYAFSEPADTWHTPEPPMPSAPVRPSPARKLPPPTPARREEDSVAGSDDAQAFIRRARQQANRGEAEPALETVMLALAKFPDLPELYVLQSMLCAEMGNQVGAADAARRALYLDRGLAMAQVALSTALVRGSDVAAADRALRAAEKLLGAMPPATLVPAGDGATAATLLDSVRAHRVLLERRGARAN